MQLNDLNIKWYVGLLRVMSFEIKQGEKQKYKVEVYKTMEGSHFEINITSQIFCIVR